MKTLRQNIRTATILPIGVLTVTTNGQAVDTYLSGKPAFDTALIDIAIGDLDEVTAAWQASTAYVLDDYVRPVAGQGAFVYKCTTAGTSGASEPTWPTVDGQTVADDTAVWTAVERKTKAKIEEADVSDFSAGGTVAKGGEEITVAADTGYKMQIERKKRYLRAVVTIAGGSAPSVEAYIGALLWNAQLPFPFV
jgi:hypothetical protein